MMYLMFFVTSLKASSSSSCITNYTPFAYSNTTSTTCMRASTSNNYTCTEVSCNKLPMYGTHYTTSLFIIVHLNHHNHNQTIAIYFIWNHFLINLQSENPCTFHSICPRHEFSKKIPTPALNNYSII